MFLVSSLHLLRMIAKREHTAVVCNWVWIVLMCMWRGRGSNTQLGFWVEAWIIPCWSLLYYNLTIHMVIHALFSLEISHLSCFKILWINPSLTSKLVHENSRTNIEYASQHNPFISLGTQGLRTNDRGEPAVSYQWTGWVGEIIWLKLKTTRKLPII